MSTAEAAAGWARSHSSTGKGNCAMMIGYHTIGTILRAAAERHRVIDPSSRDELRAAADVCKLLGVADTTIGLNALPGLDLDHIDRWLMGLLRRIELTNQPGRANPVTGNPPF